MLRFPVACISVSKKYKILGSFPIRGCFLFTCRSLRFSFVFDNLFCGYKVRQKIKDTWFFSNYTPFHTCGELMQCFL